jgi:hypothetical protein
MLTVVPVIIIGRVLIKITVRMAMRTIRRLAARNFL